MSRGRKLMLMAILIPPVFLLFIAIGGVVVQQLWNWLLPPLFGWARLTFWQALGMLALCRILFGGFGLHGGRRSDHRNMTPEERERFRQGIRRRFGLGSPEAAAPDSGATPGSE